VTSEGGAETGCETILKMDKERISVRSDLIHFLLMTEWYLQEARDFLDRESLLQRPAIVNAIPELTRASNNK